MKRAIQFLCCLGALLATSPAFANFDPDGRCVRGTYAGWTDAAVPGNASSAFMAGYYGGGVAAGFSEGFQGGASITANTMSFGGSDAMGWTESGQYQGGAYTGSRILSTVGRESLITAATLGTAQLARGGSQAALYGYQGLQVMNAGRSGYQIGTGIDQVSQGNNWGYLQIAGGGLGLAGGFTMTATMPQLNAFGGVATPQGVAVQAMTPAAQAALQQVQNGGTVYRAGQFGVQNTGNAQYWSLQNPAVTPGYAGQMGMPGSAAPRFDWMMGGTVRPGATAITRGAPAGPGGINAGGAVEAVVPPGGVRIDWFHMPD